jgi:hypothetical protein
MTVTVHIAIAAIWLLFALPGIWVCSDAIVRAWRRRMYRKRPVELTLPWVEPVIESRTLDHPHATDPWTEAMTRHAAEASTSLERDRPDRSGPAPLRGG